MTPNPAWKRAFRAAAAFLAQPRKADELTVGWEALDPAERRRAHRLFQAWLRQRGIAEAVLQPLLRRRPRPALRALLELAATELCLDPEERRPAIVHHAVAAARRLLSAREAGLVNAVLRRAAPALGTADLNLSHPAWLVERWTAQFGSEATRKLLAWNQEEAPLWLRWAGPQPPETFTPAPWPGYYAVRGEQMGAALEAVGRGLAYLQDPFTRFPVDLAAAGRPRTVLDLCAAPGGKTRALLDRLTPPSGTVAIAALDLPGPRLQRLQENLAVTPEGDRVVVLGADLRALTAERLKEAGLPRRFDAVLLDVPCSNTGVIRRRPDVRWLLSPAQLDGLVTLQSELLGKAAEFVAPGGTLVYSTCSLETEENEAQVERFLRQTPGFSLGEPHVSRPWIDGHDGGGAFPLTRQ